VFQGAHPYHIDEKGRLKLPPEFASSLGPAFTVTRGANGCLWVMPALEWQRLVERLQGESLMDQRSLALRRHFVGSAIPAALDGQGRVTLPPLLREMAGLQHEVVVVGIGSWIELWARERWDAYARQFDDSTIEELARSAGL